MQSHNVKVKSAARRRSRRKIIVIVPVALIVIGGIIWAATQSSSSRPKANKPPAFSPVQVSLPPPPPPPPPPKQEPPKEEPTPSDSEPMTIPDPVAANESPPAEAPAEAAANDSMGSNIQGDGAADGFGLVGRGSGGVIGGRGSLGGSGGSGSGSSRWAPYAVQVQRTMEDALRKHDKTRLASLRVTLRVWPDNDGMIERVQLSDATGNPELDKALQDEVFKGLRLQSPPPPDMPRPIIMRITAQRPR